MEEVRDSAFLADIPFDEHLKLVNSTGRERSTGRNTAGLSCHKVEEISLMCCSVVLPSCCACCCDVFWLCLQVQTVRLVVDVDFFVDSDGIAEGILQSVDQRSLGEQLEELLARLMVLKSFRSLSSVLLPSFLLLSSPLVSSNLSQSLLPPLGLGGYEERARSSSAPSRDDFVPSPAVVMSDDFSQLTERQNV